MGLTPLFARCYINRESPYRGASDAIKQSIRLVLMIGDLLLKFLYASRFRPFFINDLVSSQFYSRKDFLTFRFGCLVGRHTFAVLALTFAYLLMTFSLVSRR